MAYPANIGSGRIVGRFIFGVVDGPDDDQEPDYIPAKGTVLFTPSVPYLPNTTALDGPVTIALASVTAVLDEDGYLCTPDPADPSKAGYRGVRLFANNDPDSAVQNWTWSVAYKLQPIPGSSIAIPAHSISLGVGDEVDLSTAVKVPASPGVGIPQYEAAVLRAEAAAVAAQEAAEGSSGGGPTATWETLDGKPAAFPPEAHTHAQADITGLTATLAGKLEAGALTPYAKTTDLAPYAKTADLPEGVDLSGYVKTVDLPDPVDISGKADKTDPRFTDARTPTPHTHTIGNVTGLQSALDAKGTSNLTLGTTNSTAKAGNYLPPIEDMPSGSIISVANTTGTESRPTSRTDIRVFWIGGAVAPENALTGDVRIQDSL